MHCERIRDRFADYLAGTLERPAAELVEEHLAGCEDCRTAVEVWNRMGALSAERPSLDARHRFEKILPRVHAARPTRVGWTWAAAAALVVCGWLTGRYVQWPAERRTDEVATLRTEVRDLREAVIVSMLRQESANDRLKGVLRSASLDRPDGDVVRALISTLRGDPNVNVRLSAVDALKRFSADQTVRRGFSEALKGADSPVVQLALIDAMIEARDPFAATAIRLVESSDGVDETVKLRARLALARLTPINQ